MAEDEAALRCGKPLQPLSKNTPAAISHAPPNKPNFMGASLLPPN
jgi:hypothetical protein